MNKATLKRMAFFMPGESQVFDESKNRIIHALVFFVCSFHYGKRF